MFCLSKKPISMPIKKQPNTFTTNVPNGKPFRKGKLKRLEVKNLNTLPIAPPRAI